MKFPDVELPSNRKFGAFFSVVFLAGAAYFFYVNSQAIAWLLCALASVLVTTTLLNADLLLPLNKMWMRFGLLLGMIISPLVMGVIFFGLITPYGVVMRISGRDELRIKDKTAESYWISRQQASPQTNFKQQF